MIELKHVSKSYGGKQALDDVSLTLPQGEIVGLFGENGAGKTTLMKCILGFLRYDGEITLDGASPLPRASTRFFRISRRRGTGSFTRSTSRSLTTSASRR